MPSATRTAKGNSRMRDRLSCLPSEISEKILLLLSTREVVRTSVLSSDWRYKWATLPCLVFDEECISIAGDHAKFVKIVDHVLLLHIGPLHKVVLYHRNLRGTEDIDRWVLHLSRNSIKDFTFVFCGIRPYQLPASLFCCQDMTRLILQNCLLNPPCTFMGYRSLESLTLYDVMLSQDAVECLIVGCPLLMFLDLYNCGSFTSLKVDAPMLQGLYFTGVLENLSLERTPNLEDVSIALKGIIEQREGSSSSSNLVKFFAPLSHIETLHIEDYFLKYSVVGSSPPVLPQPCLYLHTLHVHMNFSDQSEIMSALCILRNSPALTDLFISTYKDEHAVVGEEHPWLYDDEDFLFPELRNVWFNDLSGIQAEGELDFIRILLSRSPVLEKMTILPTAVANSLGLLMKLIQFKRASAHAEMIYLGTGFVNVPMQFSR